MAYLSKSFGANLDAAFNIAGINRLALIKKTQLVAVTGNVDMTELTAITLEDPIVKFQEIFFVQDSANYTQEATLSATSKYITQTVNFRAESEDLSSAHAIILGKDQVALVRTNSGKWLILGLTNGLNCSAATMNGTEEDANMSFTLTGKNLGYAASVVLTDAEVDALINSI